MQHICLMIRNGTRTLEQHKMNQEVIAMFLLYSVDPNICDAINNILLFIFACSYVHICVKDDADYLAKQAYPSARLACQRLPVLSYDRRDGSARAETAPQASKQML